MPYYEFEYIIENLIDILEKKKEAEEGENESANEQRDSYMNKAKSMMPNMPNVGSGGGMPSMPKVPGMPSTSMPSFPSMPSNLKI